MASALAARADLFSEQHESAFRLFSGFYEGHPDLTLDVYARTLVIHNYAESPEEGIPAVEAARDFLRSNLPWLRTVILKTRNSPSLDGRRGQILEGELPDRKIREHGLWYALDLRMNRDASLYLDTRHLRKWALDNLAGKTVLNTFAYTGSLGVAAMGGGAKRVVHLDLNRKFLNIAKTSYTLNGFPIVKSDFISGDFFPAVARLKRAGELFDCVFLDPPFFAATAKGAVDLGESKRLINKVRPLVADGGWLVAVNNALFLSGSDYLSMLEELCADGYLRVESLIPVPEDFTGYPETRSGKFVTDPAPFNHPTKIALLRVKRKSHKQD
ncbi:MAG: class I SAM-dependent methyltransferase [Anaerolineales bacterium]